MIRNLAYIGISSPNAEQWRNFGTEVLGAQLAPDGSDGPDPDGTVRLRVDEAAWRIAIHPGEVDDVAYLGWQVDDLATTASAVEALGIPVVDGAFTDPFGFRHELIAHVAPGGPFVPARPMSGFVTGEQGLGHVVLFVPSLDAAEQFYAGALGLRRTDTVDMGFELRFFHCPGKRARHHTLALAGIPGRAGMHHLMIEVRSLDDVGTALDIVNGLGIPLAMSLGRHTNDLMTSFYVRTPSGFEIEYGTGGLLVDDETWQETSFNAGSLWGHKPPKDGPLVPQIMRKVAS